MVKVIACECCGHPRNADKIAGTLQGKQRHFFELVQSAGQAGISPRIIVEHLYAADPNGGPESADTNAPVMARQLNIKLRDFGIAIRGTKGHGSIYRLVVL